MIQSCHVYHRCAELAHTSQHAFDNEMEEAVDGKVAEPTAPVDIEVDVEDSEMEGNFSFVPYVFLSCIFLRPSDALRFGKH